MVRQVCAVGSCPAVLCDAISVMTEFMVRQVYAVKMIVATLRVWMECTVSTSEKVNAREDSHWFKRMLASSGAKE